MTFVRWTPAFPDSVALEDHRDENGNIESQVAPDQTVKGPVYRPRLRGRENMYQLEE